jgi:hypothetical protein
MKCDSEGAKTLHGLRQINNTGNIGPGVRTFVWEEEQRILVPM